MTKICYVCEKCDTKEMVSLNGFETVPLIVSSICCDASSTHSVEFDNLNIEPTRKFIKCAKDVAEEMALISFERKKHLLEEYPHLKEIGKDELIEQNVQKLIGEPILVGVDCEEGRDD